MRVLDQRGDLSEIPLPTGRAAFMERLNAVLGARAGRRGGPPHDAIRALSGDEPQDGEVALIEEFVSRISWIVADMSAPSRGKDDMASAG